MPTTLSSRFEANKGRTKGSMRLYQRGANTNFFKNSFTFKGTQDWNNLTKECRLLTSVCSFKNKLRSLFLKILSFLSLCYVCEFHCFCSLLFTMSYCVFLLLCIHCIQDSQADWPMANGTILLKIKIHSFIQPFVRHLLVPSRHCHAHAAI